LSIREWVSRNPLIAGGAFGSAIFLLLGLVGIWTFLPGLRAWFAAADWPTAEAEITASRLLEGINDRAVRPDFTFRYEWKGRAYTAQGYDLFGVYTTSTSGPQAVIQAHPVGSRVTVLVDPERPGQAVLTRGDTGGLILHIVPAVFFLVGLVGMFFSVLTGLGWLDENSRNPLGRAVRAAGGWFLQEKVLKLLFYVIFLGVILGLAGAGVVYENFLLVVVAVVMAWGLWRASRPQPEGGQGERD
jgi:hypothetical protein